MFSHKIAPSAQKTNIALHQGTFSPHLNILGNPLNFALNTKAAKFVFHKDQLGKLGKFILIPTDTTKKLDFTIKGLKDWSAAVGLHSLGFVCRMDPWELVSPEESSDVPASTKDIVDWRSKWVDDPKHADPKARGYKGVMADLVAYLISFTDAFEELKTPHGVVCKSTMGVSMKHLPDNPGQMVLGEDDNSPILALTLEISMQPEGRTGTAVLVEDARGLVENAIDISETLRRL